MPVASSLEANSDVRGNSSTHGLLCIQIQRPAVHRLVVDWFQTTRMAASSPRLDCIGIACRLVAANMQVMRAALHLAQQRPPRIGSIARLVCMRTAFCGTYLLACMS